MNNLFFTKTNEKENKSVKSKDVWSIWYNYVNLEIVYEWKFVFIFCWEASVKKRDIYSFVCASFNAKDWLNTEIVYPQMQKRMSGWYLLKGTSKHFKKRASFYSNHYRLFYSMILCFVCRLFFCFRENHAAISTILSVLKETFFCKYFCYTTLC